MRGPLSLTVSHTKKAPTVASRGHTPQGGLNVTLAEWEQIG